MLFTKHTPLLLLIVFSFNLISPTHAEEHKSGDILYSWVEDLSLRDKQGNTLKHLKEYESVLYKGEHSQQKEAITLREKEFYDYRYRVETKNGITGWVYGGGLKRVNKSPFYNQEDAHKCFAVEDISIPYEIYDKADKSISREDFAKYLRSLELSNSKKGNLIYTRPIFENDCVGIYLESCFSNNRLDSGFEGGENTQLSYNFPPFLGIEKGMTKKEVEEKLGKPVIYKNIHLYLSTLPNYHSETYDYEDNETYQLKIFFNKKSKVETISIDTYYNESC